MEQTGKMFNEDIEKGILGYILFDPNSLVEISEKLHEDAFYSKANRIIYRSMLHILRTSSAVVDSALLIQRLTSIDKLDEIGGKNYIAEISTYGIHSYNIPLYTNILLELAQIRKLMALSKDINTDITQYNKNSSEVLENIQVKISEIYNAENEDSVEAIADVIAQKKKHINELKNGAQVVEFPKTKFHGYDKTTQGLKPGTLLVLAARTGVGKTTFALNVALNVASENKRVLVFSLEMGNNELVDRLIAAEAKINLTKISNLSYINDPEERLRYDQAINRLASYPMFLIDKSSQTLESIKAACRNYSREGKLDLIVIDYIQLINTTGLSSVREQAVAEISRGLKILSRELKVPILALAQLSRKTENRESKKPMLSDIRESGAIEQDADQIIFLYRDSYYEEKTGKQEDSALAEPVELILAKHRGGSTGSFLLWLTIAQQKFNSPTPEEERDYFAKKRES